MLKMKSLLFKTLGIMLVLSIVLTVSTATSVLAAVAYPSKPVRFIIPNPPGGSNDIIGRLIATKLSERLGMQIVVDNRGGAGGIIGMEAAAKADPDGYTLLFITSGYAYLPALQKLPFDPVKSFTPIAKLVGATVALVAHPSVANSVKELIALAKSKPGKLIHPTGGFGTANHMWAEFFKVQTGIDFKMVHFKGSGPGLTDLLGGHSHFMFSGLALTLPSIKSGKLKVLGTGGKERYALLPNVPTIAEAGVPGYKVSNWYGILVPAGTPAPIVDRLNKELKELLTSAEAQKLFSDKGLEVDYMAPAEFGSFIAGEITTWGKVLKAANIKAE